MRAVQVVSPGRTQIVTVPKPELSPGHALIRPAFISLCGSDVHMLFHEPPDLYPFCVGTTGHEVIGTVEAVDANEDGIAAGDVVLALVPNHEGMSEYFLASVENVIPLPAGHCRLEHFVMAQQLGTVIFASKHLPNVVGKTAAVVGQGSAGLFFDFMLRRMGCIRVAGIDLTEARIRAGLRYGATGTTRGDAPDTIESVRAICGGDLPDVVVEAAGEESAIHLAVSLVKQRGHVVFFGVPRTLRFEFDYWSFFRKYCTTVSISGSAAEPGRTSFRQAVKTIHDGQVDVEPMITHRFPFERVKEAYELARSRDDGAVKIVVQMPGFSEAATRYESQTASTGSG